VRASALVVLALAIATGAGLAAPVGVLEVTDGNTAATLPLEDGEPLSYSYIQSVYNVLVIEEHERAGGLLRMDRVRSSDIKAVEYFRWTTPIRRDGGAYVEDAPRYEVGEFLIRITAPNAQTLRTRSHSLNLPARFGETVVTVRPLWLPRALAWWRSQ
jgi:hypothetical protein